jgi:signal transduction histidine kinase
MRRLADKLVGAIDQFARRPRSLFGLGVLLLTLIGLVDHLTGPLIAISPLYAVPVGVGAWYLGLTAGAALAALAVGMGLLADTASFTHLGLLVVFWNATARGLILGFIAWVVARMRAAFVAANEASEDSYRVADQLRAADATKNTFLNAVSHELRTPLAAILGSARTLEELHGTLEDADQVALAASISRNARRLDRLVSDLLDVDRIRRGAAALDRSEVDLAKLVAGVVEGMDIPRVRRVHVIAQSLIGDVDAAKVERVVENLVANALKYAPPDTPIHVYVTRVDGEPAVLVEDAGPGVPPEHREAVFEPFNRAGARPAVPGVGVGLSLVRAFAEMHGGAAWVEDRPGGGARFAVTLPGQRASSRRALTMA